MKHKNILIMMICIICAILVLCGCDSYVSEDIYDTDLYGTYEKSVVSDADKLQYKFTLSLNNDNTYIYRIFEQYSGKTRDKSCSGNIDSIKKINDDITEIVLSDIDYSPFDGFAFLVYGIQSNVVFKYKNIIGEYVQIDTESIQNRSNFVIKLNDTTRSWSFFEDGTCKSDSAPDEEQSYCRYKVKSNIIWIGYGDKGESRYYPIYYIVEDGVFCGVKLYWTEEK